MFLCVSRCNTLSWKLTNLLTKIQGCFLINICWFLLIDGPILKPLTPVVYMHYHYMNRTVVSAFGGRRQGGTGQGEGRIDPGGGGGELVEAWASPAPKSTWHCPVLLECWFASHTPDCILTTEYSAHPVGTATPRLESWIGLGSWIAIVIIDSNNISL